MNWNIWHRVRRAEALRGLILHLVQNLGSAAVNTATTDQRTRRMGSASITKAEAAE